MGKVIRGFMDGQLTPLKASDLIAALTAAVEAYGDKPVYMAAWMGRNEADQDAAAYVYPYGHEGNQPNESGAHHFYIHGTSVNSSVGQNVGQESPDEPNS